MKKILSIVLLLVTILLFSCKKEDILGGKENTIKKVKSLTYSFSNNLGEKDNTTKSHTSEKAGVIPINKTLSKKVLATELLEIGGEFFTATLVEESEPVLTKATQTVNGSDVYTFYKYENSIIREQPGIVPGGQFFVPSDDASDYGIIFLSSAIGNGNPDGFTTTKPALDKENKKITYTANLNDNLNLCYSIFDKKSLQGPNDLAVNFKPIFSQIGLSVPSNVGGRTITVEEVKLESGVQETANVVVTYNSQESPNISVTYEKDATIDCQKVLECEQNIDKDATILKGYYYNIIPNGNTAKVYIKMSVGGVAPKEMIRTIDFKKQFTEGKRYTISITNILPISILVDSLNIQPNQKGDIIAKIKMSDGKEIAPTKGFNWTIENPNGVVTNLDGGVVSPNPQNIVTGNSTSNIINLEAGNYYGSTKVTVTYGGLSKTVAVNVYRDIPESSYYMWDAPENAYYKSTYPADNYNDITYGSSSGSCKSAASETELEKYLGAGVYWVSNGPPFKLPDGNIYRGGLLLRKYEEIPTDTGTPVNPTPQKDFSTKDNVFQAQHFFLPASGRYTSGSFDLNDVNGNGLSYGYYWLSTPYVFKNTEAYGLVFYKEKASKAQGNRSSGFVPMPRL